MKKQKGFLNASGGITLVALVITIIVLLILAGVSINLLGGDGILNKASNAVNVNAEATAKEEVELEIAEVLIQYYEDVYVNHSEKVGTSKITYIEKNLASGTTASGYAFTIVNGTVTVTATAANGLSGDLVGTMNTEGAITWSTSS